MWPSPRPSLYLVFREMGGSLLVASLLVTILVDLFQVTHRSALISSLVLNIILLVHFENIMMIAGLNAVPTIPLHYMVSKL